MTDATLYSIACLARAPYENRSDEQRMLNASKVASVFMRQVCSDLMTIYACILHRFDPTLDFDLQLSEPCFTLEECETVDRLAKAMTDELHGLADDMWAYMTELAEERPGQVIELENTIDLVDEFTCVYLHSIAASGDCELVSLTFPQVELGGVRRILSVSLV